MYVILLFYYISIGYCFLLLLTSPLFNIPTTIRQFLDRDVIIAHVPLSRLSEAGTEALYTLYEEGIKILREDEEREQQHRDD